MQIQKHSNGFTLWYSKDKNHRYKQDTKSFSITFCPQHWRFLKIVTNGAKKDRVEDSCLDLQLWILGFNFNYTNWNFNAKIRNNGCY